MAKKSSKSGRSSARRPAAKASGRSRQKDAISLLKEDHKEVRGLLKKLEKAALEDGQRSVQLLNRIEKEITVHAQIEEEIFYPAFHKAVRGEEEDEQMFYEAADEHDLVKLVLPQARRETPGTPQFAAKAKVLKDLIEHHAEEEEKEMFPTARKAMGNELLRELGGRLEQRKRELTRGA